MTRRTFSGWTIGCAIAACLLATGGARAVEKETSLVTGEAIGELAVAGRLDVDLHAEFMASRTFAGETVLNWYHCGFSGGGGNNEVGGNFGDFGLAVPHTRRDERYPHWVQAGPCPAVRFDGGDILKGNFPVEKGAAGAEDLAIEIWLRDGDPANGEIILGWQSEDGRATSAPIACPPQIKGSEAWHHLAVSCRTDRETWYLDGKELRTTPRRLRIANAHRMVLGGACERAPSFRGLLAAVRLHDKAMTAEQVAHNARGGVLLGTKLHSWWRREPDRWWAKESKHFRHCVDKKQMAEWTDKQLKAFHGRLEGMFELAEKCYDLYSRRLALRVGVVAAKSQFRGDGIKYKIPIQPSQGSWMGWEGKHGFGFACQAPGHINPHELVHGCQGQTGGGLQGNYWEAHANFPQTYLGIYQTIPPTCCSRVSMFFPANGRCYYHARLMFEHLAQTPEYGPMFISKLWYDGGTKDAKNEYPWTAFTRLDPDPATALPEEWTRMVQRCVTWDFETFDPKRPNLYATEAEKHRDVIARYGRVLLERTPLEPGFWRVPREMAPQQLGWNLCPLTTRAKRVSAELTGCGTNPERGSDWRLAFVAVDAEGKPRYGRIGRPGQALPFDVRDGDKQLVLAVVATPGNILPVPMTGDFRSPAQEVFPYRVKLTDCEPLDVLVPPKPSVPGARHANGGGFVAATAHADATAYVGPGAQVLGRAKVLGRARVEHLAVVRDEATVRDEARVSGHALVSGRAIVRDRAKVRDFAHVPDGVVRDDARVLEHASTRGRDADISGRATLKGVAWVAGRVAGSAILDGHYAKSNPIDRGVWFTWSWSRGKNPGELDIELGGLAMQYTFDTPHPRVAWDTWGAAHGRLVGSGRIVRDAARAKAAGDAKPAPNKPPRPGAALVLDGKTQYVELPREIADTRDLTLDVTFRWDGGTGQRLIECATDARTRMFLTPADADGKPAFVLTRAGQAQAVRAPRALTPGKWTNLQLILAGEKATLRVDGKTAATNDAVTLNPEDLHATVCLLGRGLDGGHFAGSIEQVTVHSIATVDDRPPSPDPAAWAIPPTRITPAKAIMRAEPGHDPRGQVEYFFEEMTGKPGGDDSGWLKNPVYIDTGLDPKTAYAYRVRTRDVNGNETKPSSPGQAAWRDVKAFVQDTGPDGLCVIEAEHAHENHPAPDGHAWKPVAEPKGFTGQGAMKALPDKGGNVSDTYQRGSPRLDYVIRTHKTGRHWLWVRVFAHHHTADSFHAGVDFQAGDWGENISTGFGPTWRWARVPKPVVLHKPGIHRVSLWMREDGLAIDKLLLTTRGDYKPSTETNARGVPTGPGPAESPAR